MEQIDQCLADHRATQDKFDAYQAQAETDKQQMQAQIQNLLKENAELKGKVDKISLEKQHAQAELDALKQQHQDSQQKLDRDLEDTQTKLTQIQVTAEEQLKVSKRKTEELVAKLNLKDQDLNVMVTENIKLTKRLSDQNVQIQELTKNLKSQLNTQRQLQLTQE